MMGSIGPEVLRVEADGIILLPKVSAQLATIPPDGKVVALYLRTAPTHFQGEEMQCGLTAEQAITLGEGLANAGRTLQRRQRKY